MPDEKEKVQPGSEAAKTLGSVQNTMPKPVGPEVIPNDVKLSATASETRPKGEPLASANARLGMERARGNETITGAAPVQMPVSNRLHSNEQDGFYYRYFGDDPMRIEHATSLGYEFVDNKGNPCDYDKVMKVGGQVRMRVDQDSYNKRKNILNKVTNPAAERAGRDNFINTANRLNEDTQPQDLTKTRRGPFSDVARQQADGSFKEEG